MKDIIEKYGLAPHPEGGYYREIYRSDIEVMSHSARQKRSAVTHIYFLLLEGQVSRFHKVLHDEIWNFYDGSPLLLITYDGTEVTETLLGPDREHYTSIVPGGNYQAAEPSGEYSLVGCTVAPGFDFRDFSFLSDDKAATAALAADYPEYEKFV